jgi:large subunit ribosomal protein L25
LYGGKENVHFVVTESDFRHIVYTPNVYVVNLDIEGNKHNAILKDLQFHPVTDKLLHADFYELSDDKPVTVELPVKLNGSSKGVREGGKLVMDKRKLKIRGLYKELPSEINIDVTELAIGKSIRAGEVVLKDGCQIIMAKGAPVVSVRRTRAAMAAAQEAAKKGAQEAKKK